MTGSEVRKYLGDEYYEIYAEGREIAADKGYVGTDATLYARDYVKGYAEGKAKVIAEIVNRMRTFGFDNATIIELAGLTEQEIKYL